MIGAKIFWIQDKLTPKEITQPRLDGTKGKVEVKWRKRIP